jgi:NADPH:quinone reductase-like Zn-dependent oxidoreductase
MSLVLSGVTPVPCRAMLAFVPILRAPERSSAGRAVRADSAQLPRPSPEPNITPLRAPQVAAYGFLEVLQVPEGAWLLQTAAGSTLGPMLIAMAKLRGVRTINVVRRKAQSKDLLDNGAAGCGCSKTWSLP